MICETGDGVVGDEFSDPARRLRAFGAKPVRGPVQRAEKRPRGDRRIGRAQDAAADAGRDERPDAALVRVALGDDARAEPGGEGVDLEMRRRPLDVVEQTQHVGRRHLAQASRERPGVAPRARECGEQAIQRPILAEEQQLVLAAEVVIQVARRQVGGDGDVAHAGGGEAARAEHAGGGAHDLDAPRVGPFQTAVRKVNHGSILAGSRVRSSRAVP